MTAAREGRVAGKIAVVTGAAHGIGRSIALRLAGEGATVVGIDIDADDLDNTVTEIAKAGGRALAMVGDVTEPAPVERMIAAALAQFGRIDILVNNVGGGGIGRLWEASVEDWDRVLRLNLRSTFLCTKAVLADMMPRRRGRIVCLSSGARVGTPWTAYYTGNTAYAAAKAGVHGFIRNAALELAQYNVTINAVAPGPIATERTTPAFEALANEPFGPIPMTPLHRLGQPLDVANAVLFLASDEAGYITGTTLAVAGGR